MTDPQLTYASADGVQGRAGGGWGVLHRTPDLLPDQERRLVAGVSVSLPATVSAFPDSRELADRPVRFRHRLEDGLSVFWRSVEAGKDHTSRPGNVFTHAAIVQRPAGTRPVDYYWAESWLSPFGAEQVRTATPAATLQLPAGSGFASVAAWFHEKRDTHGPALAWMIDGLMTWLESGVVIRVRSSRDAAGWIGLASWMLTEPVASSLTFTTYEDGRSAEEILGLRMHVMAITDDQLAQELSRRNCYLLDDSWQPQRSAAGWQLPSELVAPRTLWSTMANDLLWMDPEFAFEVLRVRDQLADIGHGSRAGVVAQTRLALRMAMLTTPGAVVVDRERAIDEVLAMVSEQDLAHPRVRQLITERDGSALRPQSVAPDSCGALVSPVPGDVAPAQAVHAPAPPQVPAAGHHELSANDESAQDASASDSWSDGSTAWPAPGWLRSAPEHPAASPSPGLAGEARRDIEVRLVKPTVGSRMSIPVRGEFVVPTPWSALRAARILGSTDGLEAWAGTRWVARIAQSDPDHRLAMLHLVAQERYSDLTAEEFADAAEQFAVGTDFDALAPALLLLGCRIELRDGVGVLDTAPTHIWPAELRRIVRGWGAEQVRYLGFHFGPWLTDLEGEPPEGVARLLTWGDWPPPSALWGLPADGGRHLARLVQDVIALTQRAQV